MGRKRSFDETKVLESAMHAFRRHGYAGISIKQLEEATGLSSGSLYNAYRGLRGWPDRGACGTSGDAR
jgi:TetR/AcrR family transcriptional regulator, transcriptional repressor for nem operon